jgi:microcystin synthetase protein McyG
MSDLSERLSAMSPKRLALVALELEAKLQAAERSRREPIAIVGMACRFPGEAVDLDAFWSLLHGGRSAVAEVPADRWDLETLYDSDADAPGKVATRWAGLLRDIRSFDPAFFGIAPREAITMDPQQRLLMEVVWEALEHAGIPADRLAGTLSGVFNGICNSDFHQLLLRRPDSAIDAYSASGSAFSIASGRLSYFLGIEGPSLSVDTACSSSLVAVHLACQSLRNDECTLAIVSGVNVICNPQTTIALSRSRMMAADGKCKTFDAAADGFVRGEGCGVVVLKRLSQAQADGDRILAVIRGTAINQDGRSSGLTAPNGPSQERVIRAALRDAGVEPETVDYVEAHGTGTSLGDPIELHALGAVLAPGGRRPAPLVIGSVKTNIGHLESAAGVAGLIKVVLSLLADEIPAHLHLRERNPHVAWHTLPFEIPTSPRSWTTDGHPRRAGVSSFGFSGTNAHLIIEEAPVSNTPETAGAPGCQVLPVSARTPPALGELAARISRRLLDADAPSLASAAHTAGAGRSHFNHRIAVVAETSQGAAAALAGREADGAEMYRGALASGTDADVAFLFTGQGAQYSGMSRVMYEQEAAYRTAIDTCDGLLQQHLPVSLRSLLFDASNGALLDQTAYTQPALFAVEYALTALWESWGIRPSAVAGHSVGELAACCVAGLFGVEDGLRLIAARGRLMQALPTGGSMAAIHASADLVQDTVAPFEREVSIAAFNGPDNVVISGPAGAVDALVERFAAAGIRATRLRVSHAFHSPLIEPMLDEFEQIARTVAFTAPTVPIISNLTGQAISFADIATPAYWRRHAREAVRFSDGIAAARALGCSTFLEIGPHPTLVQMGQQVLQEEGIGWIASLRRGQDDRRQIRRALAQLYVAGATVNWADVAGAPRPRRVSLPTYPFQRAVYWPQELDARDTVAAPASKTAWSDWLYEMEWRQHDAAAAGDAIAVAAGAIHARAAAIVASHGADVYDRVYPALDQLSTAFIVFALELLGRPLRRGERFSTAEAASSCGITGEHSKLLARLLEILSEDGILRVEGDVWQVVEDPARQDPHALAERFIAEFPECRAELAMTARCAAGLAQVLRGASDPMQLLFPDGSLDQTEALYERAPVFRVFNDLIAEAVSAAVATLPADRPIRVLEIGAGTGSTSASVLPALPADRTEYVFTDVSPAFLTRAQQKFTAHPFVSYRTLDIEREPRAQGFDAGAFDVIIASNVLHATADLRATLARVRPLLADGGLLLLLEGTRKQRFGDLTVGYTTGWWAYADADLRSYALMPADSWVTLLNASGFEQACALPAPGVADAAIFDNQSIVLARAAAAQQTSWVIVDSTDTTAGALADVLRTRGDRCVVVAGDAGLDERIAAATQTLEGPWTLVSLAASRLSVDGLGPGAAAEHARGPVMSALETVQSAVRSAQAPERLVLVTANAQGTSDRDIASPLAAVIAGLARTIDLEHPELRCALLDVDAAALADPQTLAAALDTIHAARDQPHMAVRQGRTYASRIVPSALGATPRMALDVQNEDATYLVTGGLSGLGLEVARRLVDRGARRLVLMGRRTASADTQRVLDDLAARGIAVSVYIGDVSRPEDVAGLLTSIPVAHPLRGIVHCAGTTKDAAVTRLEWEHFREVFAAKVDGTWNLHTLTAGIDLDFFVLFSSGASFIGSKGQANHSAANAFLDALAAWRRAHDLPAVSINWGAWSGTGAATRGSIVELVQQSGLGAIDPASGLEVFEHVLRAGRPQVAVLPIDWAVFLPQVEAAGRRRVFDRVRPDPRMPVAAAPTANDDSAGLELRGMAERRLRPFLVDLVRREAARILCVPGATLDLRQPLQEIGLDSLMAVELRNVLGKHVGAKLPATLLFSYPSVQELADHLADRELSERTPAVADPAPQSADALDELSDDELVRMLASKIGAL